MTSDSREPAPAVEAVFLDVGGVFHVPDHDIIRRALGDAGVDDDIEPDRLDRAHYAGVAALERWPAEQRGMWAAYQEAYARTVGVTEEQLAGAVVALNTVFSTVSEIWSRVVPGSVAALRRLHGLGVTLAIVSNSDGTVERRLAEHGICQVGDGAGVPVSIVVDSAVVGVAKPDPGIFRFALEATGVSPAEVLYVGDTVGADVDGARAAGLRPVHLDPHDFCSDETHHDVRSLDEVVDLVATARARPRR